MRFHAVYWLALLLSVSLPLPTKILVHDYITTGGRKLAKSHSAEVAGPAELVAAYGPDAVRWWLLAGLARATDTEFSAARLAGQANTDLANGIGNLIRRVTGLQDGPLPLIPGSGTGLTLAGQIDDALAVGDFRAATSAIRSAVEHINRSIAAQQPWRLKRDDPGGFQEVLAQLRADCYAVASELQPFLPRTAVRLVRALSGERFADPLIPRL